MAKQDLLLELREGRPLALRQQTALTLQLSFPAILAQISSIVMQYIDAAMVGQLGRDASAAIGLVASSTWLFGGLCRALVVGFSVMVAQRIGAGGARPERYFTLTACTALEQDDPRYCRFTRFGGDHVVLSWSIGAVRRAKWYRNGRRHVQTRFAHAEKA